MDPLPSRLDLSKKARAGILQAVFMLAFFTVFWAVFLFWGFYVTVFSILGCAVLVGIAVFIFCQGIQANRTLRSLPDGPADPDDRRAQRRWNIIASVQGCTIGVVCAVLGSLGLYMYIVPAVALIVGIHYFPLGAMYHTAIHAVMGVGVVLIAVFGIISQALGLLGNEAIGICALAAALSTAILGVYLLRLLRSAK